MIKLENTEVMGWGSSHSWNAKSVELLGQE